MYSVAELRIAVNALSTTTYGGIIRLEPGEYDLGTTALTTFNGATNVSIVGSGRATRIIYRGTGPALEFTSASRTTVSDLVMLGMATGETGVRFASGNNNTIASAWFEGFTQNGVRLESENSDSLRNSTFVWNGAAQLYTNGGAYHSITENRFNGNATTRMVGSIGVEMNSAQNTVFSGNRASNFDIALKVTSASNWNRFEKNELFRSHMENIVMETVSPAKSYHQTFIGNLVYDASRLGAGLYSNIRVKNTHYVTFTSNSLFPRDSSIIAKNNLWLEDNNGAWIFRDNILRFGAVAGHVQNGTNNTGLMGFDATNNFAETPATVLY